MDVVLDCACPHLLVDPGTTGLLWTRCEDCGELVAMELELSEEPPTGSVSELGHRPLALRAI